MTRQLGKVLDGSSLGPGMQQLAVGEGGHVVSPVPASLHPNVVGEYFALQHSPLSGQNVVVFPHWRRACTVIAPSAKKKQATAATIVLEQ